MRHGELRKHPTQSRWAYPMDDELLVAVRAEQLSGRKLEPEERAQLGSVAAKAKALPASWESRYDETVPLQP
jgi:hypothetical protein